MTRVHLASLLLALAILAGGVALADDGENAGEPAKKVRKDDGDKPKLKLPKSLKLVGKLKLTVEQRQVMVQIHDKAEAERQAILDKETADILATLTDEQRTQLADLQAKQDDGKDGDRAKDKDGNKAGAKDQPATKPDADKDGDAGDK
jgi:hypothetical protein